MTDLVDAALALVLLAFFTSPIWYPIFAVSRLEDEVRRQSRERRR